MPVLAALDAPLWTIAWVEVAVDIVLPADRNELEIEIDLQVPSGP